MSALTSRRGMIRSAVTVGIAASLALAACGSDSKSSSGTTAAAGTTATAATTAGAGTTAAGGTAGAAAGTPVGVSLILKNTSNAFFVSMQKSAEAAAQAMGVNLTTAAGKEDGDTATQISAIEAAVAKGDKGILITPSGDAVVPALDAARKAGLYVIALDTPPNPASAVDITFATDNYNAGQRIGQWTAGQLAGKKATIAMLDLFNDSVVSVDTGRDQGFLNGMGIVKAEDKTGNGKEPATGKYSGGDYEVVCHEPTTVPSTVGRRQWRPVWPRTPTSTSCTPSTSRPRKARKMP